jgi:hypothetical protein
MAIAFLKFGCPMNREQTDTLLDAAMQTALNSIIWHDARLELRGPGSCLTLAGIRGENTNYDR